MPDDGALQWLEHLLGRGDMRQPTVAKIDWTTLAPLYEVKRQRSWMQYVRPDAKSPSALGIRSGWSVQPGQSRLNAIEHAVQKEAARVLGFAVAKSLLWQPACRIWGSTRSWR